jgi:RhoGEF domain/Variant SH3 domain
MPFENTPCGGRVVAHFKGQNAKELTLSQGDMVTVQTLHDDGWCSVDFQGKSGLFPSTYLEEAVEMPPPVAPKPKPMLRRNMSAGPSANGPGIVVGGGRSGATAGIGMRGRGAGGAGGTTQWRPSSSYSKSNSAMDLRRAPGGSPLLRNVVGRGAPSRPSRPATSYTSSGGRGGGPSIGGRAAARPGTSYGGADSTPDFSNPRNTIATSTLGVKEEVELAQKKEQQRRHVVEELIATERDYVHDLEVVLSVFVEPLKTNNLVKLIDMQSLFSNIAVLAGFNATVLKQFEERRTGAQSNIFGDIFLQMVSVVGALVGATLCSCVSLCLWVSICMFLVSLVLVCHRCVSLVLVLLCTPLYSLSLSRSLSLSLSLSLCSVVVVVCVGRCV